MHRMVAAEQARRVVGRLGTAEPFKRRLRVDRPRVDAGFREVEVAAWDIVSWLAAIGLIATVVVGALRLSYDLGLYLLLLVSGVLVPIWAIRLGTSLRGGPGSEPEAGAA
jgi:hypothetical protein